MNIYQIAAVITGQPPGKLYGVVSGLLAANGRFVTIYGKTFTAIKSAPWPTGSGVYVVRDLNAGSILYIGKTGKLIGIHGAPVIVNRGALCKRISRWHPYCYQSAGQYKHNFEYGPNFGVNDIQKQPYSRRYMFHTHLSFIETDCLSTAGIEQDLSPAYLEALLLQNYVSINGALPAGNKEL